MRISDWSSDVCSSDLKGKLSHDIIKRCPYLPVPSVLTRRFGSIEAAYNAVGFQPRRHYQVNDIGLPYSDEELLDQIRRIYREQERLTIDIIDKYPLTPRLSYFIARFGGFRNLVRRSEVHTYELQSLMRTSYAVFSWKKQKLHE